MASIVEILEEKDATVTLEYYGINNLFTSWDVKMIIDEYSLIIQYFSNNQRDVLETIDNFLDYCYADKISRMKEIIPLIKTEENKKSFSGLVNMIEIYLNKIASGNIIKFINQNYADLLDEKYRIYGLTSIVLDFIMKYQSGINDDVYKFLIREYDYLILDNYDKFVKRIEKEKELFSEFFKTEKMLKLFSSNQDLVQDIIISIINRNKESLAIKVNDVIDILISNEETVVKNISDENIIQFEIEIKSFYNFLKKIKHQKANVFATYIKEIEIKMNSYLSKNGQHRRYEIPVEKIVGKLKEVGNWELKLLMLTHTNINGIIQSNLNIPSEGKMGLLDYVTTNLETDDYYTRSHLKKVDILQSVGSAYWLGIINDKELFHESLEWFRAYINFICEKVGYEESELSNDILLLYQMLENCKSMNENENQQIETSLCYGTCMFICAIIEKILRTVYIQLKKEMEYVPVEKITLGELLADGNVLYKEIFGEYQLKHLRYFLLKDGEKKIGANYRNSLAHYNSIKVEQINMFLVGKLMFIFTNVITSFFIYFFMKNNEENIDK